MRINKSRLSIYLIILALAGYGSHELYQNVDVTYKKGQAVIKEPELEQAAALPMGDSPPVPILAAIDEREALFAKLAGER